MIQTNYNPSDMKLLLVDDTPANLDILYNILEAQGYQISVAPNGKIACTVADHDVPDLILLDVMMPVMDGFETCKELRKNEKTKNIPIIFITAKTETEDIVKCFNLGAVDYIAKPFRHEEVCVRVKTHLQLSAAKIALEGQKKLLEKQNKALNIMNVQKNEFIGIAAHDLRNPLGCIMSSSEVLSESPGELLDEDHMVLLDLIHSCSEDMLILVNNLLDVSVIESGMLNLEMKSNSLNKLVLERLRIFEGVAKRKQISLHTSLVEFPNFSFDKKHIAQVIDNLLSNAIKFSPLGSKINLSTKIGVDKVMVSVTDEGPGILAEEKAKLFEFFQTSHAKSTGGERKTGLGLAIVKKILNVHGGTIEIHSPQEKGTTFTFSLPIA